MIVDTSCRTGPQGPIIEKQARLFPFICLCAALVLTGLLTVFYAVLPGMLESRIMAILGATPGLGPLSLRVRGIGFTGADLSDIRIGAAGAGGPAIDSIRLAYSPFELMRGRIARIDISGVSFSIEYRTDGIAIDGLDLSALTSGASGAGRSGQPVVPPPFSIGEIYIRHAAATCRYKGIRVYCPFEITITPTGNMTGIERFLIQLAPAEQRLMIAGSLDGFRKIARLSLSGNALSLERLAGVFAHPEGLTLRGETDLGGQAILSLVPFSVVSFSAFCRLRPIDIGCRGVTVSTPPHVENTTPAIHLALSGDEVTGWKIDMSPFRLGFPGGSVLADAVCRIQPTGSGMAAEAEARTTVSLSADASAGLPALEAAIPPLLWAISATYDADAGWKTHLAGRIEGTPFDQKEVFRTGRTSLRMGPPELSVSAEGKGTQASASYRVQMPGVSIHHEKTKITLPMINFSGAATRSAENAEPDRLGIAVEIPQVRFTSERVSGQLPTGLRISGDLTHSLQVAAGFQGLVAFSGGSVSLPSQSITATGIGGKIPFQWPPVGRGTPGTFAVSAVKWGKHLLGGVTFSLRQEADDMAFSGKYNNPILPNFVTTITGSAGRVTDAKAPFLKAKLSASQPAEEIDLGNLHPAASGIRFNGEIKLTAEVSLSAVDHLASLSVGIKNAAVGLPEKKAALTGISTEMNFPDLFSLRSDPKQALRVTGITYGDIEATDLNVDFQIESPSSFFIEQSRFKWCRGNISAQSFRISPGVDDYRITLYCDRLNLADILKQFGAARADGEGAVNGKIPLVFSEGKLSFQDGFLYSTPGAGGRIAVAETRMLTVGMSPDSPQYMQMEIAREALKDFDYQWVKMNLSTEGKDLLMRLSFDGKPAGELPFAYKQETGGFVRVMTDAKGSVFQGIRLDVNFRLPLDDILKYKEIINLMK